MSKADKWRAKWATEKCAIALDLARGKCGGSYGEAVLILCTALSAMAAEAWPGPGIDRKRMVQLLRRFAPDNLRSTLISVPILVWALRKKRKRGSAARVRKAFLNYQPSLLVTGDNVDRTERQIIQVAPRLKPRELREFSYANILYRELRSPYVHEFRPGKRVTSWSMIGAEDAHVSYVNWVHDPDRHIHFHVDWLAELVKGTAIAMDEVGGKMPLRKPRRWWIGG